MPRKIVIATRQRNKIQKKIYAYIRERDRLIKALNELEPPTPEEFEEFKKWDLEISRHAISLHPRS